MSSMVISKLCSAQKLFLHRQTHYSPLIHLCPITKNKIMTSLTQGNIGTPAPQTSRQSLVDACQNPDEYPTNLPGASMSKRTLKEYQNLLESRGKTLFAQNGASTGNSSSSWTLLQEQDDQGIAANKTARALPSPGSTNEAINS
ncbi:hypothetical protein MCOR25_009285 [Pyricularia grisea]|nr:hypothetical protein MCOR25_009285 [Pyricularia grisea]